MYYNEKCKHLDKGYIKIPVSTVHNPIPQKPKYECKINRMTKEECPCCEGFEE